MSVDLRFVVRRTIGVLLVCAIPLGLGGAAGLIVGSGFLYGALFTAIWLGGGISFCAAVFGLIGVLVWAFSE